MSLLSAQQEIVDLLKSELAGVVSAEAIKTHRGRFESIDEIKHFAARSPSLLVAARGVMDEIWIGDKTEGRILFVIYLLCTDKAGAGRGDQAKAISDRVTHVISAEAVSLDFALSESNKLSRMDVTTLAVDKSGIALWEISWTQDGEITPIDGSAEIETWEGYDGEHYAEQLVPDSDDISMETKEDHQ